MKSAIEKMTSSITYSGNGIGFGTISLEQVGLGFVRAAYLCMVLVAVLMVAAVVGFSLVNFWVEEPISWREKVFFDYTDANPKAIATFGGSRMGSRIFKKDASLPVGHTIHVCLALLMPESDYNRNIGVFQLTAELLSIDGEVITKSSQPCMLRFRSYPIRMTRTLAMGVPLVLGIMGETQKIVLQILKHKQEISPRSKGVRVTLHPRAGTCSLPQIYEAEITIKSNLPWMKNLIRNWKWTFYVWMSFYLYILMLMILLCCCKNVLFPELVVTRRTQSSSDQVGHNQARDQSSKLELEMPQMKQQRENLDRNSAAGTSKDESDITGSDVTELLRRWRQRRSKRKAVCLRDRKRVVEEGHGNETDMIGGASASSMSFRKEDDASSAVEEEEEEVGDSESVVHDM